MKHILVLALILTASSFADGDPTSKIEVKLNVMTDSNGMTVYTFDPDTVVDGKAVSNCNGACAVTWPPVPPPTTGTLPANFSTTNRADGSKQLTYRNHPVYLFEGDRKKGDTNGSDLSFIWHVVVVK
jgi:predicted lipoprotein with Yx(FWY)xxD motif